MEQRLRAVRPQDVVSEGIGARVEELRKEKSWSQERLASYVGSSRETIRRVESGIGFPDGDTFIRLAVALGVTPNDLLPDNYAEVFDPARRLLEQLGQRYTAAVAPAARGNAASSRRSSRSSKAERKLVTTHESDAEKLVTQPVKAQAKTPTKRSKKQSGGEGLVTSN